MTRNISKLVGRHCTNASLTITATVILSTIGAAQKTYQGPSTGGGPAVTYGKTIDVSPKNRLRFPYGVQNFEHMKTGNPLTDIPGWKLVGSPGPVAAFFGHAPSNESRSDGAKSKSWVCIEDTGASASEGFFTPNIVSPDPWDYAWSFDIRIDAAPLAGSQWPKLAIQHDGTSGFQDAWGIELTDAGANLFVTNTWGWANSAPIFTFTSPTGIGQWINIRVVSSLEENHLEAFVNGVSAAKFLMRPKPSTNVERQRFSYHGDGAGNSATVMLDDLGIAFLSGVCKEDLLVDFTGDEEEASFANGRLINSGEEYGTKVTIDGANDTNTHFAAIFDSDTGGLNDPSQDTDLIVDQGNILILQNDAAPPLAGCCYPNPNDDEDGGTFTFGFPRAVQPLQIDVIDIDDRPEEGVLVTLTDTCGLTRTYTVPSDWTGDNAVGVLDLMTIAAQPGNNATQVDPPVDDAGYNGNAVVSITLEMGGSGALDNFMACIPCVELTFEVEDDGTPGVCGMAATALLNGQDISTPPEFGTEVAVTSFPIVGSGGNNGTAIFDSTPGGPNQGGPDNDLLVGTGNILILQNNSAAGSVQTNPGYYDQPNDDQDGGTAILTFLYDGDVEAHYIDVIDFDEEDVDGITITLTDSNLETRTYEVPGGYTEDLLNEGFGGIRRVDLTILTNQAGFISDTTASETSGFDPEHVVSITLDWGGPGGVDNICFCP